MTQREQFEEWWKSEPENNPAFSDPVTEYVAWRAWQAAQQNSEPDKSVAPPTVDWVR